jgi:hypothetical protein
MTGASRAATTTGAGAVNGALTSAGAATNSGGHGAGLSGQSLLCAGLLGSGALGNVLSLAPVSVTPTGDPNTAIQFSRIWSDAHRATVGGQATDGARATVEPPVAVTRQSPVGGEQILASRTKSVVATVRLPIAFSAIDRRQFEEAGWRPVVGSGDRGAVYCLDNAGRAAKGKASSPQGMVCVAATP